MRTFSFRDYPTALMLGAFVFLATPTWADQDPCKILLEKVGNLRGVDLKDFQAEGTPAEVYLGTDGFTYKRAKTTNTQRSLQAEFAVAADLQKSFDTYGVHAFPIEELGTRGAFIKRAPFDETQVAGRILERQGELTAVQSLELEKTFIGIRRYAAERDIHLDLGSGNLIWDNNHWVIYDTGPRDGAGKTKIPADPNAFEAYLEGWNHKFLAQHRSRPISKFLDGSMPDDQVPFFLAHYFPEMLQLTNREQSHARGYKKDTAIFPSERVFGKKYDEFDRTVNGILFLRWVKAGNLEAITKNQKDPKLSSKQLAEIQKLLNEVVKTPEDWDAMLSYMAVRGVVNAPEAFAKNPSLFPSLVRLPKAQQTKILQAMAAHFSVEQFTQAGNLPKSLEDLHSLKPASMDFYLVRELSDTAGVLGNLDARGNMFMNSDVYRGFSHGLRSLRSLNENVSSEAAYLSLLQAHAKDLKFSVDGPTNYAVAKLSVWLGVTRSEDVPPLRASLKSLPRQTREGLIAELNKTGIGDHGILVHFLPAFLKNLRAHRGVSASTQTSLPMTHEIFQKTRELLKGDGLRNGVFTVHIPDLKNLAQNNPELLATKSIFVKRLNHDEAILEIKDKAAFEDTHPEFKNLARFLSDFRRDAFNQAHWVERDRFVGDFRDPTKTDAEIIAGVPEHLLQSRWLTASATRQTLDYHAHNKSGDEPLPSKQLFGQSHGEFDRTVNKLMFFRWLQMGDDGYRKMTAAQAEGKKLSRHNFDKLRDYVNATFKTEEHWRAALAVLEIRDLGRVDGIRQYVEHEIGSNGLDNDAIFQFALRHRPDLFPAFGRLSPGLQKMVLEAVENDFNVGQFLQGENVPASLLSLSHLSHEAFRFKMCIFLASVAGAAGNRTASGNLVMQDHLATNFFKAESILDDVRTGAINHQEGYRKFVSVATNLKIDNAETFANARLFQQLRLDGAEDQARLLRAMRGISSEARLNLIQELGGQVLPQARPEVLAYWAPQIFDALLAKATTPQAKQLATQDGLEFMSRVFKESRKAIAKETTEAKVYTVNMEDAKAMAAAHGGVVKTWALAVDSFGSEGRLRLAPTMSEMPKLEFPLSSSISADRIEADQLSRSSTGGAKAKINLMDDHMRQQDLRKLYQGTATIINKTNENQVGHVVRVPNFAPDEIIADWAEPTFDNGLFKAIRTDKPIVLIRAWGGKAQLEGGFFSIFIPKQKMDVKINLAVKPEWMNNYANYSIVEIDPGAVIYIGDAAVQKLGATGTLLDGGDRQMYIPNSFELWQRGKIREVYRGDVR